MMRPGVNGPTSFILTMTFLPAASTRAYFGLAPYRTPPNFLRKLVLMAAPQAKETYRAPEAVSWPPSRHPGWNGLYMDAAPTIALPEAALTTALESTAPISLRATVPEMASTTRAPQIAALERNTIMTPLLIYFDCSVADAATPNG